MQATSWHQSHFIRYWGLNFFSVNCIRLLKPVLRGVNCSWLHNVGDHGFRWHRMEGDRHQRSHTDELPPVPGPCSCHRTDSCVRNIFDLLCANSKDRTRCIGTSVHRCDRLDSRCILIFETVPTVSSSSPAAPTHRTPPRSDIPTSTPRSSGSNDPRARYAQSSPPCRIRSSGSRR
jgi:hypothetical protein